MPGIFKEKRSGKTSLNRAIFAMWNVAVAGVWVYASIRKDELAAIPESVAAIVGMTLIAKVGQRFVENKDTRAPDPILPPPPVLPPQP